jgi:hypothetical protein
MLAASAAAHAPLRRGGAQPRLVTSGGDLGSAAAALAPGDSLARVVRVSNPSDAPVLVLLAVTAADERAGRGGGRLSRRLRLTVQAGGARRPTWAGTLADAPPLRLGRLAAHGHASYQLRLGFPDGGTPATASGGDNAYQGAQLRLALAWTALSTRQ